MVMVKDALRGYLALASGVTEVTAARARAAARVLVEQGESTAGQVTALAEDLVATSRRNREGLLLIVRHEFDAALRLLGLGPAGDIDALDQRVRRLEQTLRDLGRGSPNGSTGERTSPRTATAKKAAKKAAPAKTSAKTSAKAAPKKPTAKKPTSAKKSTPAEKSTAKSASAGTVSKAAPKRTAARRSTRRATGRRS